MHTPKRVRTVLCGYMGAVTVVKYKRVATLTASQILGSLTALHCRRNCFEDSIEACNHRAPTSGPQS